MDLVIAHVSKDYGRGPVLRDVSLTVRQGETVGLMGPSGLGKTTLLRCVAGLETPDAGAVTGVPRRLGYVFQEDRLCDNFSAVANIWLVTGRTLPEKAILQHLEEHLAELSRLLERSEDAVLLELEQERERVTEALRRQHPEIASYLAAHREELEQRFQRKYPEAARHIHELRQRLHQPPEEETKEQR